MCRQGLPTGSSDRVPLPHSGWPGTCYVGQASLKLSVIILPPCPKYWDYRYIPPWRDLCVCVFEGGFMELRLAFDLVCSQGYPEHLTILLCLQSLRITRSTSTLALVTTSWIFPKQIRENCHVNSCDFVIWLTKPKAFTLACKNRIPAFWITLYKLNSGPFGWFLDPPNCEVKPSVPSASVWGAECAGGVGPKVESGR